MLNPSVGFTSLCSKGSHTECIGWQGPLIAPLYARHCLCPCHDSGNRKGSTPKEAHALICERMEARLLADPS